MSLFLNPQPQEHQEILEAARLTMMMGMGASIPGAGAFSPLFSPLRFPGAFLCVVLGFIASRRSRKLPEYEGPAK